MKNVAIFSRLLIESVAAQSRLKKKTVKKLLAALKNTDLKNLEDVSDYKSLPFYLVRTEVKFNRPC